MNCENCDETNCLCDWNTIYSIHQNPKSIGFPIGGIYYQTYGGGPEGGYLMSRGKLYSVHRSWGEKWTLTRENGVLHFRENEIGDKKGYVKFVQNGETSPQ